MTPVAGCFLALSVSVVMLLSIGTVPVAGQLDGSFWWMNTNLLKQAEALRETKDVKAIVVTKDSELDAVRVGGNSLVDNGSPDCICVPLDRCNSHAIGRDGLCGAESVCCRRAHIIAPGETTTTTVAPTTTIRTSSAASTKLEPVDSLIFDSDPVAPGLSETVPFRPLPPNGTAHDPNLLLELSNLLLSHSLPDTFNPIDSNSLPVDTPPSTESQQAAGTPPAALSNTGSQCGRRQHSASSRIFFQDDDNEDRVSVPQSGTVGFGEFPWTVAVYQLIRNGSFVYHCGGALLNSTVVVTAAHCVSNNRLHPNRFVVHAGDWDRRHTQERLPHQERTVDRVVVHPGYYSGALFNDLALLFFREPLNGTRPNIAPVCLPGRKDDFVNDTPCYVTGWGGSPTNNRVQSVQQFSKLSIVERQQCEAQLQTIPSLGRKFKLHPSFMCAAGNETDVCKGSGGSPLVCERDGRYRLHGIVSWGIGCGDGIPAVLADVAALSEWITAQ
uniref:Peptidase S1 domain-containing protein n=1 Tax=Anopheles dirus TaxID=7168 RepID=A0A182N1F7_9DIPT